MSPRIGLALSGGGFRAAAFHLGVLKRLEELSILHRVEALSCVSGGAIVGAFYALRCVERGTGAPGTYPIDSLIAELRPVLARNLRGRALFGTPIRGAKTFWSFVSRGVSRIGLMVNELDQQLYGGAALTRLPEWILINATSLRTGKAFKFYRDRAGDFLMGATEETAQIRIAEAVAASAAYPGLTDSYGFRARWEAFRSDLLSEERWERPPQPRTGGVSRWRERYGKVNGPVIVPLVDGGLYDNEGLNGLHCRIGRRVTHAILSGAAPPETDYMGAFGLGRLLRVVDIVHDRLGAATRQLAHEMTHGLDPSVVASRATTLAERLRELAAAAHTSHEAQILAELADEAATLAAVGTPPRGHQFIATAQVLLHRDDLARNAFREPQRGGFDVPDEYRGLEPALVSELSRVRTDLDALDPVVVDLLIAQGYFLTDFFIKLTMPGLVFPVQGAREWYNQDFAPAWQSAHESVAAANANGSEVTARVMRESRRVGLLGSVPRARERWRYRMVFTLVASPLIILALAIFAMLAVGGRTLVEWVVR